MISCLVLVCLAAKLTSTSSAIVDTSIGSSTLSQTQDEVHRSPEVSQLIKMQEKIDELEKKQESLMVRIIHTIINSLIYNY
ncbi:hypothetical protein HOLleu_12652 [Holothuria leucospilota]|uniref:Uncharacterized protein n=1 Tax=Holothuria leucospilota TaxID=206669 RepID=A0A9Q1CBX3_HOLLE|nr:hypothetical protein HOLleu_12652 [Holothuria leucospilota]